MDPSSAHLNNLILGVCHLCDRTRELAKSETTDTVALMPVREALHMVSTTLEALCSTWEEAVPARTRAGTGNGLATNWLFEGESRGER